MMIDSIRTFLKSCPYLKNGRINVDYLGPDAEVDRTPSTLSPPHLSSNPTPAATPSGNSSLSSPRANSMGRKFYRTLKTTAFMNPLPPGSRNRPTTAISLSSATAKPPSPLRRSPLATSMTATPTTPAIKSNAASSTTSLRFSEEKLGKRL